CNGFRLRLNSFIFFQIIQSSNLLFIVGSFVRALAKNGSFGFLSVGSCVGKNQMCHLWVGKFFKNNFYSLHYLFSKVFVNASHFLRWLCKLFVHGIIIFYWCSRIPLRSI